MVIKASRRAMFRGMFGRVGYELPIETAHEILMRLNRLMDPIPVSVPMWDAYLAARRPLRYVEFSRSLSTDRAAILLETDQAAAHADFSRCSDLVSNDLGMLLRVEILLRMWTSSSAAGDSPSSEPRRREIAQVLRDELLSYLRRQETDDAASTALAEEVAAYLLKEAARMGAPRSQA